MKIALVHDDFTQLGGAESLFATIASIWPDAPIYTSLVNWQKLPATIDRNRIRCSWIQKLPSASLFYKALLPLYPLAFESFSFDDFDVVISSTTRFAKAIITKPATVHICYINSLPRFLYSEEAQADYLPKILQIILRPLLQWLKRWDKVSAQRVDFYIANSGNIRQDLAANYKRESVIIYPFADLNFFKPAKIHKWKLKSQNYFLVVSRLVKWKKIEIAIKASAKLDQKLLIVGDGPDKARLTKIAQKHKSNVEFVGRVTRQGLCAYYQNCQALVVTQDEDFGIAQVEAQGCGRPVIAYGQGGQTEIIKEKETGLFFSPQTAEALEDAIKTLSGLKLKVSACRKNALNFSQAAFAQAMKRQIKEYGSKQ